MLLEKCTSICELVCLQFDCIKELTYMMFYDWLLLVVNFNDVIWIFKLEEMLIYFWKNVNLTNLWLCCIKISSDPHKFLNDCQDLMKCH